MFQVEDLFVAGAAFEFVGAILLARGIVLVRWRNLVAPGLDGIEFGSSSRDTAARIKSWTDAAWGVSGLSLGFGAQAVAYLILLRHGVAVQWGGSQLVGGLIIAVGAALVVVVSYEGARSLCDAGCRAPRLPAR